MQLEPWPTYLPDVICECSLIPQSLVGIKNKLCTRFMNSNGRSFKFRLISLIPFYKFWKQNSDIFGQWEKCLQNKLFFTAVVSCSPDPTTYSESTNPIFHEFVYNWYKFCESGFLFVIGFCFHQKQSDWFKFV